MDRLGSLIAIACLLGGCAPQWTRSAGTEWADQEETARQRQAEFLTSPLTGNFYGSPMELYGQNYRPAGRRQPQGIGSPGPMFDIDPVRRTLEEDRLTEACMRAKKYTPVN